MDVPTAAPIKFRNGAPMSQHLWVGGIGASVTKEMLQEEFSKFGKLESIKFLKDRCIAFINYVSVEDACEALKNLNGRQIMDGRLCVDFARPHPSQREQQSEFRPRDPYFIPVGGPDHFFIPQDLSRSYSLSTSGQQPSQSFVAPMEPQLSKILLVRYPPSVFMDEKLLYSSMILYGEIEGIKSFPAMSYTLVEFRSVEEAWRAKESLEGRLLNDPRITITFSAGESAPINDLSKPYHREELPLQAQQVDEFGVNRAAGASHVSGTPLPGGPRTFEPTIGVDSHYRPNIDPNFPMDKNYGGLSPADRLHHSPVISTGSQRKIKSSGWDVVDVGQISRDSKRPRINESSPFRDPASTIGKGDKPFSSAEGGSLGPMPEVHGSNRFDPSNLAVGDRHISPQSNEYIWRGVIAKGGTVICQARSVPIGQGIEFNLPNVINCSAKTGLDMLTKHYADAVGFDVSFFLPDSEEDFAPYTEFLHYLGSRNRAGVAKFDDGTALFLVPPSDFLRKVLKVVGPERLYGVVLKSPHQVPSNPSSQQPVHPPMPSIIGMHRPPASVPDDYALGAQKERDLQLKYSGGSEYSPFGHKVSIPSSTETLVPHSISQHPGSNSKSFVEHAGVKLTPDLVASLASILPTSAASAIGQSAQVPVSSVTGGLPAPPLTSTDRLTSQSWNQQYQNFHQTSSSQQFGNQLDSLAQSVTNSHSHPVVSSSGYQAPTSVQFPTQNFAYPLSQHVATPSMLPNGPHNTAQSHNLAAQTQATQHHQFEVPHNAVQGFGAPYGAVSTGSYVFQDAQQPMNPSLYDNQIPAATYPHANGVSGPDVRVTSEPLNQLSVVQPVASGGDQGTGQAEGDKDQRYQSALQFAANLLFQIQQRQQEQGQQQRGAQAWPGRNQQ